MVHIDCIETEECYFNSVVGFVSLIPRSRSASILNPPHAFAKHRYIKKNVPKAKSQSMT